MFRVKKRKRKYRQVIEPCQITGKKTLEHEGDGDTNCSGWTRNGPQRLGKETGRTGYQKKNQDHPDHSSVKSAGKPRRVFET